MVDRLTAGVASMTDERLLQALDVLGACVRSKLGTSCELVPEDDGGEFETFTCVTHGETVLEEFEICPVRKALHLAGAPSEPLGEPTDG